MALLRNNVALGTVAMPATIDVGLVAFRCAYTLVADVAAGDIIELGYLPADAVPVDLILDTDDLDTGATGTVSVALLNSGKTDIDTTASGGAAWLTGQSIQAATAVRADAAGLLAASRCAKSGVNRPFGIKIVGETAAAAGAKIGVTLIYRAA